MISSSWRLWHGWENSSSLLGELYCRIPLAYWLQCCLAYHMMTAKRVSYAAFAYTLSLSTAFSDVLCAVPFSYMFFVNIRSSPLRSISSINSLQVLKRLPVHVIIAWWSLWLLKTTKMMKNHRPKLLLQVMKLQRKRGIWMACFFYSIFFGYILFVLF